MTLLSEANYEELSREVEKRLNTGWFDTAGLYSSEQQNYRAMWCEAMDQINQLCLADFERWQPLRKIMTNAMDNHRGEQVQEMRKVLGINTTLNGREDEISA